MPAGAALLAAVLAVARSHTQLRWLQPRSLSSMRTCLLLALLASSTAQQGEPSADTICGRDGSSVFSFDSQVGFDLSVRGVNIPIEMDSLSVFSVKGKPSLDISDTLCQRGMCPVFVNGKNLDTIVATDLNTAALIDEQGIMPHHRAFCFFGLELPCSPLSIAIQSRSLMCSSPTLPAAYGIAPFGLFVLGPTLQPPGVLYLADGLELNFYDSKKLPEPLWLEPPYSDQRDLPGLVRVMGLNFGESLYGIFCMWVLGGEEQEVVRGNFDTSDQTAGDDEGEIVCPGPLQGLPSGEIGYLRISTTGPGEGYIGEIDGLEQHAGGGAAGSFSKAPPGAPPGTPYGAPLIFFDMNRKPHHHAESDVSVAPQLASLVSRDGRS